MSNHYINVSVRITDAARVREFVTSIFSAEGFLPIGEAPAAKVVDDEDLLPNGDDWYGVMVSGVSGSGWVTVYVEDWPDSGVLARELSRMLSAPVLEIWVDEDVHWGYNYFEAGNVIDRFADDPLSFLIEGDAALWAGEASLLMPVLTQPVETLQAALVTARAGAGEFAGPGVDALAQAVGLPFEHVFTGYEFFFTDDPEDYGPSLERWQVFRHLVFRNPSDGRETLAELELRS